MSHGRGGVDIFGLRFWCGKMNAVRNLRESAGTPWASAHSINDFLRASSTGLSEATASMNQKFPCSSRTSISSKSGRRDSFCRSRPIDQKKVAIGDVYGLTGLAYEDYARLFGWSVTILNDLLIYFVARARG